MTFLIVRLPPLISKDPNDVILEPFGLSHSYFGGGLAVALQMNTAELPSVRYFLEYGKATIFGCSGGQET